jgi:hypothetical protein
MPATFGELRDQMEEALQARDHDQWCRLFDIYRRGTELLEKKDLHLGALLIEHIRTMRPDPNSPSTRQ